jgi:ribosomal protein L11
VGFDNKSAVQRILIGEKEGEALKTEIIKTRAALSAIVEKLNDRLEKEQIQGVRFDHKAIEALKKEFIPYVTFDKKDGLISSYEAPAFEPTFKNTFPDSKIEIPKEILIKNKVPEDNNAFENNETETVFVNAPINEYDFENSFNEVYEPTKHNYKETSIKVQITETLIDEKKQTIETHQNDVESILDKFLKENPSITRPKSEFFDPTNVAKMSVVEKDEIVSETLAGIYLKQGLIKKAISTYEKLSLIYPHKITYFAALINQLKTEHNII